MKFSRTDLQPPISPMSQSVHNLSQRQGCRSEFESSCHARSEHAVSADCFLKQNIAHPKSRTEIGGASNVTSSRLKSPKMAHPNECDSKRICALSVGGDFSASPCVNHSYSSQSWTFESSKKVDTRRIKRSSCKIHQQEDAKLACRQVQAR